MQDVAEAALKCAPGSVVARVVEVKGFSTLPRDGMVVIEPDGAIHGDLLGRPGAERLRETVAGGVQGIRRISIEIEGPDVSSAGLACGGRADVLLQPLDSVPPRLWSLLSDRAPVALIAGRVVVDLEGRTSGDADEVDSAVIGEAVAALRSGRTGAFFLEGSEVLIESWVPSPRLVVVGTGEMVPALEAQAGLLGWELRSTAVPVDVGALLEWAGATAALVVLSHDPHVDVPALAEGLERGSAYVGAMGSRSTQSRRLDRLAAIGVSKVELDRIHRPIGLDLGGRRAAEVALAIVAEIVACHYGHDARPLSEASGPIHG